LELATKETKRVVSGEKSGLTDKLRLKAMLASGTLVPQRLARYPRGR
jgi:hypothetical protein